MVCHLLHAQPSCRVMMQHAVDKLAQLRIRSPQSVRAAEPSRVVPWPVLLRPQRCHRVNPILPRLLCRAKRAEEERARVVLDREALWRAQDAI
eukprot:1564931-Prymnesium_polylepis.1